MLFKENIYDVQISALDQLVDSCGVFNCPVVDYSVGDYVLVTGYVDSSVVWLDRATDSMATIEGAVVDYLLSQWSALNTFGSEWNQGRCEVWHVVPDVNAHVCEVTDVDIVDVCEDSAALAHTLLHIDWRDSMDGATGKAAIIVWNDGQNSLSVSPDWQGWQPDFLEDAVDDATMLNLYGWPMIGSLGEGEFNFYEDAEYIMNAARAWADSVMVSNAALRQLRSAGRIC